MIGSSRFLILFSTWITVASSMGYFGGNSQPKEPRGDWPDRFPEKPDDFEFGCRKCCPCVCPPVSTGAPTTTVSVPSTVAPTTEAPTSTAAPKTTTQAPTVRTTEAVTTTVVPSTAAPTTPAPTSTVVSTTTRPVTTPAPTTHDVTTTPPVTSTPTTAAPTTPTVTTTVVPSTAAPTTPAPTSTSTAVPTQPVVTTTRVPTTQPVTTTVVPSTAAPTTVVPSTASSTALPSANPIEPALQQDIVEGENPQTDLPQTGTTFWIRTPTPPDVPAEVVPGSGSFSLGPPLFATVKIVDPFAPDAALDTLDARAGESDGFDFNIKPVGKPQAPRAVIDPDA